MLKTVRTVILAMLAGAVLAGCATTPTAPGSAATSAVSVQILAVNDFHGNLAPPGEVTYADRGVETNAPLGGAARLGGTLADLRAGHPASITVAAGDLIGASPLASAYFLDEPTVAVLGAMGLSVASVGNHEFDRGIAELRRMQDGGCAQNTARAPCALEPFAGAAFTYLAGNAVDEAGDSVFPGTTIRQIGPVRIGFIGLTLNDTGSLVSPAATRGYRFLDEAETANRLAGQLRSEGAQVLVLLIHQGGYVDPAFNAAGCPGLSGDILPILDQLDPAIGLVVSGHTHKAYVCETRAADGSRRLLTSAGRYGYFVTDIELSLDPLSGRIESWTARNVPVDQNHAEAPQIATMVQPYIDAAGPVADRVVGTLALASQPADCVEGWAADLVADAQLAAAAGGAQGGAQIAFINSGGVRAELVPAPDGAVSYGQIFRMQPFGNVIEVLELTGAQLKQALEQQFCEEGGRVASCFSSLIPSAGFAYAYDLGQPANERIVKMALDGQPIVADRSYRVAVNNFLANGGDGFAVFAQGREIGEAGVDLDALEAFLSGGIAAPTCGRVQNKTAR